MSVFDSGPLFEYRDPSWPSDSVWRFRRELTGDDADRIRALTTNSFVEMDMGEAQAIAESRKKGGKSAEQASQKIRLELRKTADRARVLVLSQEWEGAEFELPVDVTDGRGVTYRKGAQAPCNAFFIGKMRESVLVGAEQALSSLTEARSAEAEAAFPPDGADADESENVGGEPAKGD